MQEGTATVSLPSADELIKLKARLAITRVFKSYLLLLEQLADEHNEAMGRLYDALPEQYKPFTAVADHFTEAREEAIRKWVLDIGNREIRDLDEQISVIISQERRQ